MRNIFIVIFVLGLMTPGRLLVAQAAVASKTKTDDKKSFDGLKTKAEKGNADAQYQLSRYYSVDHGDQGWDAGEQLKWLISAAKNGHGLAQMDIAQMNGAKPSEQLLWYRKAADQGFAWAQFNLGVIYANDHSNPQNRAESMKWYLKAAMQGVPTAQNNVAVGYYNGDSGVKNLIESYAWFAIASHRGLTNCLKSRDQVATKLSSLEIVKAKNRTIDLEKQVGLLDLDRLPPDLDTDDIPENAKKRSSKSSTNENKSNNEEEIIRKSFDNWVIDLQDASKDITLYYANSVDYFFGHHFNHDNISSERKKFWGKFTQFKFDALDITYTKINEYWQCRFTKKYAGTTHAPAKVITGIAKSEVWFGNVQGNWLIVLEKDLK